MKLSFARDPKKEWNQDLIACIMQEWRRPLISVVTTVGKLHVRLHKWSIDQLHFISSRVLLCAASSVVLCTTLYTLAFSVVLRTILLLPGASGTCRPTENHFGSLEDNATAGRFKRAVI